MNYSDWLQYGSEFLFGLAMYWVGYRRGQRAIALGVARLIKSIYKRDNAR